MKLNALSNAVLLLYFYTALVYVEQLLYTILYVSNKGSNSYHLHISVFLIQVIEYGFMYALVGHANTYVMHSSSIVSHTLMQYTIVSVHYHSNTNTLTLWQVVVTPPSPSCPPSLRPPSAEPACIPLAHPVVHAQ